MSTTSSPLLSVIIITCKRPDFLLEAINCVLNNGVDDLEIVVSDDDPAQSGKPVVDNLKNPRVRYFANPGPHGIAANSDFGSRQARGKYGFKLDDDDLILPGFLPKTVALLEKNPSVGSVYTAFEAYDLDSKEKSPCIDTTFFQPDGIVTGEKYIRGVLLNEGGYPQNQKTTMVYRRDLAQAFDFYKYAADDYAFSVALAVNASVAYVPEVLYQWRQHGQNFTGKIRRVWQMSRDALNGLEKLPTALTSPTLKTQWPAWIRRCRDALPLFYLQAAIRHEGKASAWQLYKEMRDEGILANPLKTKLILLCASLFPQAFHVWFFKFYRNNRAIQVLARTFLASKS